MTDIIISKKDLLLYLKEDSKRNNIKGFWNYYLRLLGKSENACAFHYLKCLRKYEYHLNNSSMIMHKIMASLYKFRLSRLGMKYNIRIMPNTCGYGLKITHLAGGGGMMLNAKKIGNYCSFNSGSFVGNKNGQNNRPVIGNHVSFGPGAKAFGNLEIGNNVFVAANAVVTKSIPDDCVVGGVPAKIIKGLFKDRS